MTLISHHILEFKLYMKQISFSLKSGHMTSHPLVLVDTTRHGMRYEIFAKDSFSGLALPHKFSRL
tara:strand:+ start:292 stop:486 length:195 start_codon:yes stop_codon:yes gene_type:complete